MMLQFLDRHAQLLNDELIQAQVQQTQRLQQLNIHANDDAWYFDEENVADDDPEILAACKEHVALGQKYEHHVLKETTYDLVADLRDRFFSDDKNKSIEELQQIAIARRK